MALFDVGNGVEWRVYVFTRWMGGFAGSSRICVCVKERAVLRGVKKKREIGRVRLFEKEKSQKSAVCV